MRKGNSWEILRVFTLSFQNSSDTQTAFPGMENDAQTKSRGKKAAPTWGKKRQFQPGAKKGSSNLGKDVPVGTAGTGRWQEQLPQPPSHSSRHRGALCTAQPHSEG